MPRGLFTWALSQGDVSPAGTVQAAGPWAWLPGADMKCPREHLNPLPGPRGPPLAGAAEMTAASQRPASQGQPRTDR